MSFLALDQSSNISGWAIFDDNDKLESYGTIEPGDRPLEQRLTIIRNYIKNLISDFNIKQVLIEDIQMQANVANNVKTYKALAEVIGVVTELLNELKIPFELIPASTWKSTLGIKGANRAAQKANAQKYIKTKYNLDVKQDICDAICIGCHFIEQNDTAWSE